MIGNEPSSPERGARVLSFRRSQTAARPPTSGPAAAGNLVRDLVKYQRSDGPDDYRHRMIVNLVAFVFIIALIGAGLWVADTMARMRKNQDCVLSGRRGCSPVEVIRDQRWGQPADQSGRN